MWFIKIAVMRDVGSCLDASFGHISQTKENEDVALYPCMESAVDLAMALAQKGCNYQVDRSVGKLDMMLRYVFISQRLQLSGSLSFPSRDGDSLCAFLIRVLRLLPQMSPGELFLIGLV
ncbi:hypothetical protein RHGRI_002880 [Rhododendron griersonianum]|uniref:Uncharacterized protein n=1 Tax=Rhododendron griersonianum TaxID=479676 RepID=A0AAV6LQQ5_9ERIC|nr:hypothetical protein RHGRI_002880 [Rhododendron griersonianum]